MGKSTVVCGKNSYGHLFLLISYMLLWPGFYVRCVPLVTFISQGKNSFWSLESEGKDPTTFSWIFLNYWLIFFIMSISSCGWSLLGFFFSSLTQNLVNGTWVSVLFSHQNLVASRPFFFGFCFDFFFWVGVIASVFYKKMWVTLVFLNYLVEAKKCCIQQVY